MSTCTLLDKPGLHHLTALLQMCKPAGAQQALCISQAFHAAGVHDRVPPLCVYLSGLPTSLSLSNTHFSCRHCLH